MRQDALLLLLGAAQYVLGHVSSPPSKSLFRRDYSDVVCKPATEHGSDTVPPCTEIETIETICTPNGTAPLFLKAHQECMCGGSYFSEWPACLDCLYFHGLRTERDVNFYDGVLSSASSLFCDVPTPTAEFATIFASLQSAVPYPSTGDTATSDRAVSQTAVSLYYTASGTQGPGQITGSATAATATVLVTAPTGAETSSTGSKTGSTAKSSSSSSTSSSSSETSKPNQGPALRAGVGSLLAPVLAVGGALVL